MIVGIKQGKMGQEAAGKGWAVLGPEG